MTGLTSLVVLIGVLAAEDSKLNLTGTVRDDAGKPLAGVRVDVDTAAPRIGRGIFCPSCYLDCRSWTTTDAAGRFTIPIRDPTLKFRLLATLPGKKPQLSDYVEPNAGDLVLAMNSLPTDWPVSQILRGQIVDDQGQPVSGALIEPHGAKTTEKRWWGVIKVDPTVSDREGRFVLLLPENYQGIDLRVRADGFAGATTSLLEPGRKEHSIVIPTGTRVTGRVVRNGKPVAGLRVAVVQVDRSANHHFIQAVEDATDEEGRFVFEFLPAEEPYVIYSLIDGSGPEYVLSTKRFRAHESRQTRDLGALEVIPSIRLSGRVVLPPGESLPSNPRLILDRDPAWDLVAATVSQDGRFEFVGLPPETYEIRTAINGFTLDPSQLRYQQTSDTVFGIRVDKSVDSVTVPLARVEQKQ